MNFLVVIWKAGGMTESFSTAFTKCDYVTIPMISYVGFKSCLGWIKFRTLRALKFGGTFGMAVGLMGMETLFT